MGGNEHLTIGEFERGIRRIEARFDRLDEKIDGHGERLAVLEQTPKRSNRRLAVVSTVVTSVVVGTIEGLRRVFGS